MKEQPPEAEMNEFYLMLANIRDDYLDRRISHATALQRMQEARERFKPDWWQNQVMILAIEAEYHRRLIRAQWLLIAILCLITLLELFPLVLLILHR
jgi:hypothetical protein